MKILIAFVSGCIAGYLLTSVPEVKAPEVKVFTRIDTVRVIVPEVMIIRDRHAVKERLALFADTTDSADVRVPVQQSVYHGDEYRAVVSGHNARLDSIEIFQPVTTIVHKNTRRQRISIGLQGGYGITPKGFQPYVGVGVSIRIM